jgi:hypothetical protein
MPPVARARRTTGIVELRGELNSPWKGFIAKLGVL